MLGFASVHLPHSGVRLRAELRLEAGAMRVVLPPSAAGVRIADDIVARIKRAVMQAAETSSGFRKRVAKIDQQRLRKVSAMLAEVQRDLPRLRRDVNGYGQLLAQTRAALDEIALDLSQTTEEA
jgi:hypothetical protein